MSTNPDILKLYQQRDWEKLARMDLGQPVDAEGDTIVHIIAKNLDWEALKHIFNCDTRCFTHSVMNKPNKESDRPIHKALQAIEKSGSKDYSMIDFMIRKLDADPTLPGAGDLVIVSEKSEEKEPEGKETGVGDVAKRIQRQKATTAPNKPSVSASSSASSSSCPIEFLKELIEEYERWTKSTKSIKSTKSTKSIKSTGSIGSMQKGGNKQFYKGQRTIKSPSPSNFNMSDWFTESGTDNIVSDKDLTSHKKHSPHSPHSIPHPIVDDHNQTKIGGVGEFEADFSVDNSELSDMGTINLFSDNDIKSTSNTKIGGKKKKGIKSVKSVKLTGGKKNKHKKVLKESESESASESSGSDMIESGKNDTFITKHNTKMISNYQQYLTSQDRVKWDPKAIEKYNEVLEVIKKYIDNEFDAKTYRSAIKIYITRQDPEKYKGPEGDSLKIDAVKKLIDTIKNKKQFDKLIDDIKQAGIDIKKVEQFMKKKEDERQQKKSETKTESSDTPKEKKR